ncbi:MAG: WD40 repeat domain-containing protein [Aggregatilineales bacterium]
MMKFFVGVVILLCFFLPVYSQDVEDWGTRLSWSPDGQNLAIGFRSGVIEIRNGLDGSLNHTLQIPNDSFANDVDWSPEGDLLAAVAGDNHIYIWNTTTWDIIRTINIEEDGRVHTINWNSDNTRLAGLAQQGGTLYIWNTSTGENLLTRSSGGSFEVSDFDWYGENLAVGFASGMDLIDTSGNRLGRIGIASSYIIDVASNYNNHLIASGTQFGRVQIWDETNGTLLSDFIAQNYSEAVFSLDWHPDGVHLATGGADGNVTIWDTQREQLITTIEFSGQVTNVEWSPDGSQLAYTGIPRDTTTPLWEIIPTSDIGITTNASSSEE